LPYSFAATAAAPDARQNVFRKNGLERQNGKTIWGRSTGPDK